MDIKIAYCPDHGGTKTVVAAGEDISEVTHVHGDASEHTCTIITEGSETQPTAYPHIAADTTSIADPAAWLAHLKQYVP